MSGFAEFITGPVVTLGAPDLARLKELASKSAKNRYRFCVHDSTDHPVQEMLICARGHTYLPPHRHPPGKCESYHVVEGQAEVYLMDESGAVLTTHLLGDSQHEGAVFIRIAEPIFHFVFPRSDWFIYHEVFSGPWSLEKSVIPAPFSPPEDDAQAIAAFVREVTGVSIDL
ncbi:MAG: hypothetical protein COW30_00690 [Rhodospirillales bacterium CG15_BIG_FIL_POST_REV_8_21_14_020_66_15]|nr:MAG: hypothetical protein COW30_00690 [Rhodospirillales bacterium CG15_BIG_FIL_POST_REV_8_21_14_020_66_15]